MHTQIFAFGRPNKMYSLTQKTQLWPLNVFEVPLSQHRSVMSVFSVCHPEAALTYRVIGSTSVDASTFFEGYALVVAEDEAWVTLTTLHTQVLTARWTTCTHACFWTGTHAQRVGTVGWTVQGFVEEQIEKESI